jgi:mannose-6-phosphate isomerase-like protein (cupin superfamily)
MAYTVFRHDQLEFRTPQHGNQSRGLVPLSEAMHNMRANIWRMPPGARGRRHLERVQDEMFVVLDGTATMLLGDPPERVELPRGSVVVVESGTALQLRNESDGEITALIVGAPPVQGQAEYLPDVD